MATLAIIVACCAPAQETSPVCVSRILGLLVCGHILSQMYGGPAVPDEADFGLGRVDGGIVIGLVVAVVVVIWT